ncbi:MAG: YbaB/EbfC family nucleoid-associated protein [Chloroflexota bacterium]
MNLDMLNQAREMKAKMEKMQKELNVTMIETEVGKGAVRVTITGQLKIKSIKISPEVIDPKKAGHLEEMVQRAVNDAIDKSQKLAAKQLKEITGGLKIPGLM